MLVPSRHDLLGDAHRRLAQRPAARVTEERAALVDRAFGRARAPAGRARARAGPRGRGSGRTRRRCVSRRRPSVGLDPRALLPRDDVRVRHDEVAGDDEPGSLLDPVARRRPRPCTTDCATRAAASAGIPPSGGSPASGEVRVSNTSGNVWSPTRRPSVSDSSGGSGAKRSMVRATTDVAHGAGRPPRRARQRGDEQPHRARARRARRAPRRRRGRRGAARRHRRARAALADAPSRSRSRSAWPIVATSERRTRATRAAACGAVMPRSASATSSTSATASDDAERESRPRRTRGAGSPSGSPARPRRRPPR